MVAGVYFWRLSVLGDENPEGVKILSVHSSLATGNQELRLALAEEGDRLLGVDPHLGTVIVQRAKLIGTRIEVLVNGARYEIVIARVRLSGNGDEGEQFWVPAGMHRQSIETYDFRYHPLDTPPPDPNNPLPPLCSEGDGDPTKIKALVFGGDIYNPVTKVIQVGDPTIGWINIACADSAPFKMHKIGYTTAAQGRLGIMTTLEQRHAMLNAWTANVCGTGTSFTEPGHQIVLRESRDVLHDTEYNRFPTSVEAIWDEHGAVCLNVPRLSDVADNICTRLWAECDPLPPPCDAWVSDRAWLGNAHTDWSWTRHGYVLTGNLDRF